MSGKDRREKIKQATTKELWQWLKERTKATEGKSTKIKHQATAKIKSELRGRGMLPPSTKH